MNIALCLLLAVSLGIVQWMVGGAYPVYAFPAYALAAVAALLSLRFFRRPSVKPVTVCVVSALGLAAYLLVRGAVSPHFFLARADLFLVGGCVAVYLLSALVVTSTRARMVIVCALFAVAVAHTLVGLMQFTENGGTTLFGMPRPASLGLRASGMLLNPNYAAGYLNAAALLFLGFTLWGRWSISFKLVLGYLLAGCFVGIALTGSRGGYLGLLAGLVVFTAGSLRAIRLCKPVWYSQTFMASATALIVLLAVAFNFMPKSPVLAKRVREVSVASWEARHSNVYSALEQFRLAPLLGTGAGTWLYFGRYFRLPGYQGDGAHAHNDYMELLAEYGATGGVLLALFLCFHLQSGVQAIREEAVWRLRKAYEPARSNNLAMTLGALGAVAALLVHSVVDSNMHLPGNALLYAFLFGILGSPGTAPDDEVLPASRAELGARGVLAAVGGVLLLAVAWQYPGERALEKARMAVSGPGKTPAAAVELAARAVQKAPWNPQSVFYLGEANRLAATALPEGEARAAALEAAIEAYQKALDRFPEDAIGWMRLGQTLDAAGRAEEAEDPWSRAVALDPNRGVLYADYAVHLLLMQNEDGADRCREAARKLDVDAARPAGPFPAPERRGVRNGLTAPALAP